MHELFRRPTDMADVTDWSVRGAMSFYGVLEMTGDEAHWRGLGLGLRKLLEHRIVQVPFAGNEAIYQGLSPFECIGPDAPPFFVIQGRNDTLVDVQVARDFVEKFRHVARAPIYYVELPFTQHAFDLTASPRTSATTRAAIAFAESVVRRPRLSPSLVQSYQVPPTELVVQVTEGEWVHARDAARALGRFTVLTSDNPFSNELPAAENAARRLELFGHLQRHDVRIRDTISRDPLGAWPGEEGFALFDQSIEFARELGKAWDQFAIYDVTEDRVLVRSVETGEILS